MKWNGVMPAITTCFTEKCEVDHAVLADHSRWLIENGCKGIVALGSLGEGATLHAEEKLSILETLVNHHKRKSAAGGFLSPPFPHIWRPLKWPGAPRVLLRRADDSPAECL